MSKKLQIKKVKEKGVMFLVLEGVTGWLIVSDQPQAL